MHAADVCSQLWHHCMIEAILWGKLPNYGSFSGTVRQIKRDKLCANLRISFDTSQLLFGVYLKRWFSLKLALGRLQAAILAMTEPWIPWHLFFTSPHDDFCLTSQTLIRGPICVCRWIFSQPAQNHEQNTAVWTVPVTFVFSQMICLTLTWVEASRCQMTYKNNVWLANRLTTKMTTVRIAAKMKTRWEFFFVLYTSAKIQSKYKAFSAEGPNSSSMQAPAHGANIRSDKLITNTRHGSAWNYRSRPIMITVRNKRFTVSRLAKNPRPID